MERIIKPLSLMGADIESTEGHAPITIKGRNLSAINYQLPVASAQVKSAILLAGLFAEGQTVVKEEYQSRDHTERMLSYLGADLKAKPIEVPSDISSAAFFIIATLLLKNSKLTIKNVGVNPTRIGLLEVLQEAGAAISRNNERSVNNEPVADLVVESSTLKPFEISGRQIPLLVDEIPILAVAATQINGTSVIRDAQELRLKESDRLKAISTQLNLMGAKIEEKEDGLVIEGPTKLKGATVESGGDHRMAMSLAIAGLLAQGETTIKAAECINISFPGFRDLLKSLDCFIDPRGFLLRECF
jgi:3-phosphoshikimate 1-carboxyvinyltransferase